MRRSPRADFERAPHRASSHPQSPINLPVKQILGLYARITRRTDAWIYARFVKSTATILSRRATPASHISSSKIVWESSRGETPIPPRGRRTRPPRRLSDQHEPEERVLVQRPSPRFSAAQNHESKILVAESRCLFFPRTINNSRDVYIVAYKISHRYRQVFNCGARHLRVRETRYSKRRIQCLIFFFDFLFSSPFVRRPFLHAWRCDNK